MIMSLQCSHHGLEEASKLGIPEAVPMQDLIVREERVLLVIHLVRFASLSCDSFALIYGQLPFCACCSKSAIRRSVDRE
jgi:hypothetical protein